MRAVLAEQAPRCLHPTLKFESFGFLVFQISTSRGCAAFGSYGFAGNFRTQAHTKRKAPDDDLSFCSYIDLRANGDHPPRGAGKDTLAALLAGGATRSEFMLHHEDFN